MKINTITWLFTGLAAILLVACNKENNNFLYTTQIFSITVKGYNATSQPLSLKVDTFKSAQPINGPGVFNVAESFTFKGDQRTVKLSINEKNTGKVLLEKEFTKEEGAASLNLLYMDDKLGDMPEKPAVADGKISLIYMFVPEVTKYSEPVDFVIGKYFITPAVFEEITRIKNVKPNTFSEPATFATFSTAQQDYNGVKTSVSFQVRIYKAGTNTPYVDGTAYTWTNLSSTAPKPSASAAASKLYIFSEFPSGTQMRFSTRLDY